MFKSLQPCFAQKPHVQIILHAKAKFESLPTAFAVILKPVALPIVPKVEFNFEVIKYITNFVS